MIARRARGEAGEWRRIVRDYHAYRELLYSIVRRDFAVRYKQTVLGFGWALFVPLVNMLVFTAVFTRVAPLQLDLPYPVYAYSGLLPWSFFAGALHAATTSLTANSSLLGKVYFPRAILPLSSTIIAFVDFVLAASVLAALMVYYGIGVTWTALLLPFVVIVQVAFTLGFGLILAMGNLYYRDVRYVSTVGITVWMFATSVVYPLDRVGGRLGAVFALNPMTAIIDAYRSLLLYGDLPKLLPLASATVIAIATFLLGWRVFHMAEPQFAEIA
jgi:homopolymeric O-antigen transport system permease protein